MSGQNRAHIVGRQTQAARLRYGQYQKANKPVENEEKRNETRKPFRQRAQAHEDSNQFALLRQRVLRRSSGRSFPARPTTTCSSSPSR